VSYKLFAYYLLTSKAFVAFLRSNPISRSWLRAFSSTRLAFSCTGNV